MQDQEDQHVVVGCKDQMQMIMKGKRTKRQRQPSPLRLTMSTTTTTSNSSAATTTTSIDHEFRNRTTEEEEQEDMANCLILLAQGHHHTQKKIAPSKSQHDNNNNNNNNNNLYECKTCNKCFSSFQALGGHRASHKKLKANNVVAYSCAQDKKEAITTGFVNDHGFDHNPTTTTNTNLTLQLSSRGLYSSNTMTPTTTTTTKSKVHECSICGAEFNSGQALGGHMRRHRSSVSNSAAISMSDIGAHNGYNHEAKKARNNVLKLDLNLPAPEDHDNRESKFPFRAKEKVIVFSATSLVDCHY